MADFALNEDQLQIQKWVHDFAEDVIRPAGHEWDEREEFPYPIVEQAAEIGLYGWEFLLNSFGDPTGLTLPVAMVLELDAAPVTETSSAAEKQRRVYLAVLLVMASPDYLVQK